jgi:hypothetical protein
VQRGSKMWLVYVLDTLYKDSICQDKFMQMICFEKKKRNDISIVLIYSSMCLIYFVLAVRALNTLVAVVPYAATLLVRLKAERAM